MKVDTPGREGWHCLVEAVCQLYFLNCSFTNFIECMQTALKKRVFDLTPEEEAAFIGYYKLKSSSLRCPKSILVEDLEQNFLQLTQALNRNQTGHQPPAQRATNGAGPAQPRVV